VAPEAKSLILLKKIVVIEKGLIGFAATKCRGVADRPAPQIDETVRLASGAEKKHLFSAEFAENRLTGMKPKILYGDIGKRRCHWRREDRMALA
jgi:hypothetical protein